MKSFSIFKIKKKLRIISLGYGDVSIFRILAPNETITIHLDRF